MLQPFVVLVRPVGSANLSLHGAAAPDATVALAAVSQSLRESGRGEDVVVGVFHRQDLDILSGVFHQLDQALERA